MDDIIYRQAAIELWEKYHPTIAVDAMQYDAELRQLPHAQPTIYGYNVEHLELIARILQKENMPPERIVEVLTDIGRIVAIIQDEFEETLRKAVEQCMT